MYAADSGLPMIRFATLSRVFWCSGSLFGSMKILIFDMESWIHSVDWLPLTYTEHVFINN